jgi:hypothetical protein
MQPVHDRHDYSRGTIAEKRSVPDVTVVQVALQPPRRRAPSSGVRQVQLKLDMLFL